MFLHEERPFCDYSFPINPQQTTYNSFPPEWKDAVLRSQYADAAARADAPGEMCAHQTRVSLQGRELWDKFRDIGNEMIITKAGRRMFPACKVSVTGLNPKTQYVLMMDMVPFDDSKYKWNKDRWEVSGVAEPHLPNRFFIHPDSPAPGERWMQYPVAFHKLKLTNNTLNANGLVILHSMHKYQPRVHILQAGDTCGPLSRGYLRFSFPEAAFIAVTAYQNPQITKLKIDNNPFAKGFRDHGLSSKRQRERPVQSSTTQPPEISHETGRNSHSAAKAYGAGDGAGDGADLTVSSSGDARGSAARAGGVAGPNPFISAFMKRCAADAPCAVEEWAEGIKYLSNQGALPAPPYASSGRYEGRPPGLPDGVVRFCRPPRQGVSLDSLGCGSQSLGPQGRHPHSSGAEDRTPHPGNQPQSPGNHPPGNHPPVNHPPAISEPDVAAKARVQQQQPDFDYHLPHPPKVSMVHLPHPPKVSRVHLPESTLRSLEMASASEPSSPRPLSDIISIPRPLGDIISIPRPLCDIINSPRPLGDIINSPHPLGDIINSPRPLGDIINSPRPLGDIINSPHPLGDIINRIRGGREDGPGRLPPPAQAAWPPLAPAKDAFAPPYQSPLDRSGERPMLQGMLGYPAAGAQASAARSDARAPLSPARYPYKMPLLDFYINDFMRR